MGRLRLPMTQKVSKAKVNHQKAKAVKVYKENHLTRTQSRQPSRLPMLVLTPALLPTELVFVATLVAPASAVTGTIAVLFTKWLDGMTGTPTPNDKKSTQPTTTTMAATKAVPCWESSWPTMCNVRLC